MIRTDGMQPLDYLFLVGQAASMIVFDPVLWIVLLHSSELGIGLRKSHVQQIHYVAPSDLSDLLTNWNP